MFHQEIQTHQRVPGVIHQLKTIKVLESYDYDRFLFMGENRKVSQAHVASLKESIMNNGFLDNYPVQVSEDSEGRFWIIDGQHRFTACRELGAPIRFTIRPSDDAAHDLRVANALAKPWKDEDFLNHFCQLKNPSYLLLKQFMADYQLGIYAALTVLSGNTWKVEGIRQKFRTGQFTFTQEDVDAAAEIMLKVNEVRFYDARLRPFRTDRPFLAALITVVSSHLYNHAQMMKNVERGLMYFVKHSNVKDYLTMLTEIYNRHIREGNRIEFTKKGGKAVS